MAPLAKKVPDPCSRSICGIKQRFNVPQRISCVFSTERSTCWAGFNELWIRLQWQNLEFVASSFMMTLS